MARPRLHEQIYLISAYLYQHPKRRNPLKIFKIFPCPGIDRHVLYTYIYNII